MPMCRRLSFRFVCILILNSGGSADSAVRSTGSLSSVLLLATDIEYQRVSIFIWDVYLYSILQHFSISLNCNLGTLFITITTNKSSNNFLLNVATSSYETNH